MTFLLTRELNRSLIPHLTRELSRELMWTVSRTLKPEVTWGVTPQVTSRTAIPGVGSGKSPPERGLAEAVAGPEIRANQNRALRLIVVRGGRADADPVPGEICR